MINDIVAVDGAIHRGEALQGFRGRTHEEAHEAEARAVVRLFKVILVACPEIHNGLHVHFVKGGQHGRGLLGFHEAPSDGRAEAGHGDAPLRTLPLRLSHAGEALKRFARRRRWVLRRCGGLSRSGRWCGRSLLHIFLGNSTVAARTPNLGEFNAELAGRLPRGGGSGPPGAR